MPKFCASLVYMFNEVEFLDRFERAARAGFRAVEIHAPYKWSKEELAEKLDKHGLEMVAFLTPIGNWEAGELGVACLPGREAEFQEGIGVAIEYAKALRCSHVTCHAGMTPRGVPSERVHRTLVNNLRFAASTLEKEGIHPMLEPLSYHELPRYREFHLLDTQRTLRLIEEVDHPNLWLEYDAYHMQLMEGNLTRTIVNNLDRLAYIQIADVPGRHEPGTGEINYPNLFRFIDGAGYDGWICCEYIPTGVTEAGLGWIRPYLVEGQE